MGEGGNNKADDLIKKLVEETSGMSEEEKINFLVHKNELLKQYVQQHLAEIFNLDESFFTKDANVVLPSKEISSEPIIIPDKKYPEARSEEELDRIWKANKKNI